MDDVFFFAKTLGVDFFLLADCEYSISMIFTQLTFSSWPSVPCLLSSKRNHISGFLDELIKKKTNDWQYVRSAAATNTHTHTHTHTRTRTLFWNVWGLLGSNAAGKSVVTYPRPRKWSRQAREPTRISLKDHNIEMQRSKRAVPNISCFNHQCFGRWIEVFMKDLLDILCDSIAF